MKKLFLASTSTIYGSGYLEYLLPILSNFFKEVNALLFIPYARPSGIGYDDYTKIVSDAFKKIDINVVGIHTFDDKHKAIEKAEGIFVGGGNTFVLVHELYQQNIMEILKNAINKGKPYLGTSAGSNIAGLTMQTTNDMPIVYPPSYTTLGCIPFNVNAHYLNPDPNSKHRGETRETRIKEFHTYNDIPVIGLREGSWLQVNGDEIVLKGDLSAKWFEKDKEPIELETKGYIAI
ncbi:dipeptidase PepE [Aureibaculum sp. 2210JD6-5]|uniref:dipeptidase PepE n=1 Tax=Aureibaculum sp. 2210JD6-5 TaxID=3103957 RepID=UPI002AAED2EB|nr:dipeptidase PepE [Aureibaculum sp. 2210JD6-5]MDY7394012.1 dipeptidase PepE [Aureibaculum sp. 2210JD6-5]